MQNKKKILCIIGILFVVFVILMAFFYRKKIEQYAMTGYFGVFVACFVATSTILLPAPGIFVVIQYAQILNPVYVVILGGLGTSLGEMIGYMLGRLGKEVVDINPDNIVFRWFNKKPLLTVFLFSLIPFPVFDIVGITAGMNKTNPVLFWISCFLGKTIKMGIYVFMYIRLKEYLPNFVQINNS